MADRIVLNSISYHGKGAIENIVPELQNRGKKKVLVCTDASLLKFGVAQKVTDPSQRKRAIFDRVVISGETALSSLTEEDIRALFFS